MILVVSGGFSFQDSSASKIRGYVVVDEVQRLSVSGERFSRELRAMSETVLIVEGLKPLSNVRKSSMIELKNGGGKGD